MALAPDTSAPATSDLQTVSVVCFANSPITELWIDTLKDNNAEMLEDDTIHSLGDITRQKLAVILDQNMTEKRMTEIIEKYEEICEQNPLMSLRFFCLVWSKEVSNNHDRLRIINLKGKNMGPDALPARVNHALFKARLPGFLRKNYEVEISDTLEQIHGILYRPITILTYKKGGEEVEIDYETENLYIHEKRLFYYYPATRKMEEIEKDGKVFVRKNGSKIPAQIIDLVKLQDLTTEE